MPAIDEEEKLRVAILEILLANPCGTLTLRDLREELWQRQIMVTQAWLIGTLFELEVDGLIACCGLNQVYRWCTA